MRTGRAFNVLTGIVIALTPFAVGGHMAVARASQGATVAQAACSWDGTWTTTFTDETDGSDGTAVVQLVQVDNSVLGKYDYQDGIIAGDVTRNALSGQWGEAPTYAPPDYRGDYQFTITSDCSSFTGVWRYAHDSVWSSWDGVRVK